MATPENLAIARLDGTARRLLREKADVDTCLAELHAITTDPVILGRAAGTALGAWHRWQEGSNTGHDGDRVARMLTAAGADETVREQVAAETKARLDVDARRPGIGMPTRSGQ